MGLFSKINTHVKALNKMANAVSNVSYLLDQYDNSLVDEGVLPICAWICKTGIEDVLKTGAVLPIHDISTTIKGRLTRIKVSEAYDMSIGRLLLACKEIDDDTFYDMKEIIRGSGSYQEIDSMLSPQQKKDFMTKTFIQ